MSGPRLRHAVSLALVQDITETKEERAKGANAAIRKLAVEDLPELRTHLRLARVAVRRSADG